MNRIAESHDQFTRSFVRADLENRVPPVSHPATGMVVGMATLRA
jgi:hypothetical protein